MSKYVDGFVLPLRKDKLEEYRAIAEKAGAVWKEHGALEYMECAIDDPEAKELKSFAQLADAGPDDTVIFAWITFESREHRDAVNAKVMQDPRLKDMCGSSEEAFDHHKMAYGGFKPIVAL